MDTLQGPAGLVSEVVQVLELASAFYRDLFQERQVEEAAMESFLGCLSPRLANAEHLLLERPLSVDELGSAMLSLKCGSAPGGDGLPIEFYRTFWHLVGPILVDVFNESLAVGQLPASMRTGLVTLIHKKGPREDLANWRPITVLSADYKVLAKVLTRRLGDVLGTVVLPEQTCGVRRQSGSLSLGLVRDVMAWVEQRGLPLAILSLDQEKAFDRVSRRFLFGVLQRLNFGPLFVRWVRLLYTEAVSRIKVGGHLSPSIAQAGGVRQGCPLSPFLYILAIEPLLSRLRQDPLVQGVHLPGGEGLHATVSAYADDVTVFVTTDASFPAINVALEEFGRASGA